MKIKFIYFFILFLITTIACSSRGTVTSITFTGDIIMHLPVKNSAYEHNIIDEEIKKSTNNRGFDFLFQRITDSIKKSDMAVGNMEFPIAPPFTSKPWIFNCHPSVLDALKKSGFTMMHIANNHILDQKEDGVRSTIHFLRKHGLDYIGADLDIKSSRSGIIKNSNGIRIGFIGYTSVLNYTIPKKRNGYYINLFHFDSQVFEDIHNIKKQCDYLIMVAHTGSEYALLPEKRDQNLMKQYINAGVDLIIGHHPHVLQPIEKYKSADNRNCFIFYSLGNFISNQGSKHKLPHGKNEISTRDSVILTVQLSKEDDKITTNYILEPIRTINTRAINTGKRVIQPISIVNEIKSLASEKVNNNKKISLQKRIRAIKSILFYYNKYDEITFLE